MKVWIVMNIYDNRPGARPKIFKSKEKAISEAKKMFKQETGKELETLTEIRVTNFQKKEEVVWWETDYNDDYSFFVKIFEEEVD